MAKTYSSHGVQLQMGDGANPENFTPVAQIGDLVGPPLVVDTVDATTHGSAAKEFVPTIADGGEPTFPINWDPAEPTHKNSIGGLLYVFNNKLLKDWRIVLPTAANDTISFSAYIVGFEPEEPVAGKLTAKIKLRVSGAVTFSE